MAKRTTWTRGCTTSSSIWPSRPDVEPHYEIISGYRSPESNDKMSSRPGSGVAKKSLHMQGRAMDVRLQELRCATLRDLALAAKRGGVGYYQRSDFVHIDTGAFRTWVG